MVVISIDGACRRNGKPDCISAGAVFIQKFSDDGYLIDTQAFTELERASTNQRGELNALLSALRWCWMMHTKETVQIVTDSEYLFNAMTKEWFVGWENRNWTTASQEPVKNADLWIEVKKLYSLLANADINYYHIKGHCIPFGAVTAHKLLNEDPNGLLLLENVYDKFDTVKLQKQDLLVKAQKLSAKNNGFELPKNILRKFVVANVVADAIASDAVNEFDKVLHSL